MTRADVDVLVVGAGVAGLSVALGLAGARSVLVLSKGDGSTPWAQGGIAAAVDDGDDPADHAADTAAAGAGLCAEEPLRTLVEDGPLRLAELLAAGARFDRAPDGRLSTTLEGGHRRRRVVHAGGDATGAEVSRALLAAAHWAGIEVQQDATVVELTCGHGPRGRQVTGALLDIAGTRCRIVARAVVLATGGIGNAYLASTNPPAVTGDGLALALHAGASLVDMEFVQFHPTVLRAGISRTGQLPLLSEAVRGEGAVLRDAAGAPIMAGRHAMGDLAPRDIVARAIDATMRRDGSDAVLLDATRIDTRLLRRRFPTVVAVCARAGIDATTEPIPVAPAEHFCCGGVRTDAWGATDVPGLFAVGEVAATGVHGANRLASNSLLEGLVFGRRTAARLVLDLPPAATGTVDIPPAVGLVPGAASDIRRILSAYAGIRRSGTGLQRAAAELAALRCETDARGGTDAHRVTDAHPGSHTHGAADTAASPLWTVAGAVVAAATARRESRGCHWRSDYPVPSELWLRRVVVRLDDDGRPIAGAAPARVAA